MAKGSGSTRSSNSETFHWSGTNDYHDVLNDALTIFRMEAKNGLGSKFMQNKPKEVSENEYQKLLDSGEYIEIEHSGAESEINQMINGKYYINRKTLNSNGFGYYFSEFDTKAYGNTKVYGLIKKSDIYPRSRFIKEAKDIRDKYLGEKAIMKNGKPLGATAMNYALEATVAASKGYKVAQAPFSYVVVDRSALIMKKK